MKLLKTFFILSLPLITLVSSMTPHDNEKDSNISPFTLSEKTEENTISLRGLTHYIAQQKLSENYTCDEFPRVCRLKSSAGSDCCKKKCVNVKTDRLNCGMCGHKCKYPEICCKGKCVNASFERRHCGGCNNKCKKGEVCAFGMCSYA